MFLTVPSLYYLLPCSWCHCSPRESPQPHPTSALQVFVRIRPLNERELTSVGDHKSLEQRGISTLHLFVNNRHHDYRFDDVVGADGTQDDIFTLVGKPMVNNVMQGYNACCFAYGQTGSGKTHTMHGDLSSGPGGVPNPRRGLAPRVFEAVFKVNASSHTFDPSRICEERAGWPHLQHGHVGTRGVHAHLQK